MKLFIFLICLILRLVWAETGEINLEVGEKYSINQGVSEIWVENKKIVEVRAPKTKPYLKALRPGLSHVRLNSKTYLVRVQEIGTQHIHESWQQFIANHPQLNMSYCEHRLCLRGEIKNEAELELIMNWKQTNPGPLYLAMTVPDEIKLLIQKKMSAYFRKKSMTPVKVEFGSPWTIYYNQKKFPENSIAEMGLLQKQSDNNTSIADNVKVSVKVVEISKNFEQKIGLHWPDAYQAQVVSPNQFNWATSFEVALGAAEKSGEAKILASPNLLCRSGKEANFFAGGEFPIKVINNRNHDVTWKRYGIGLKLQPQVDPQGQMSLKIETEVSTLDRSMVVDGIPAIHSNKVSSHFDLIESQTIALSGLIKNESGESSEGLPFLKNIPILGLLFSSKNYQENKSELVIFVTPELDI